uniref:Integrase catalytic domain-containing protein n=1 Tax=Ditylenchus dipsaci TaxID=166011 RepID=A0A915D9Z1_9BILA
MGLANTLNGQSCLILVYSFSKYAGIIVMQSLSAAAVVTKLKSLFGRLGQPKSLVSSGDALFSSQLFSQFCKANGIQQIFTQQSDSFVVTFQVAFDKMRKGGIRQETSTGFLTSTEMLLPLLWVNAGLSMSMVILPCQIVNAVSKMHSFSVTTNNNIMQHQDHQYQMDQVNETLSSLPAAAMSNGQPHYVQCPQPAPAVYMANTTSPTHSISQSVRHKSSQEEEEPPMYAHSVIISPPSALFDDLDKRVSKSRSHFLNDTLLQPLQINTPSYSPTYANTIPTKSSIKIKDLYSKVEQKNCC